MNIAPKYFRLLNQILTNHLEVFLHNFSKYIPSQQQPILNYLDLLDLCEVRGVNHLLKNQIHNYYKLRLKNEIDYIITFQDNSKDKAEIFMKNIDSQIPISNNNWLNFDINTVTEIINSLSKEILIRIKSIKKLGKYSDLIYAPFCILLGQNVRKYFTLIICYFHINTQYRKIIILISKV